MGINIIWPSYVYNIFKNMSPFLQKRGTRFAGKIFNEEAKRLHYTYIQREIEILRQVPIHDNIVKFIAVQRDVSLYTGWIIWG